MSVTGAAARGEGVEAPEVTRAPRRVSLPWVGLFLAVIAVLVAFAVAVRRPATAPQPFRPAPDFTLTTFDGQVVRLAELRGKVVLVNFWASWCLPCAREAADLEAIWRDYRDRGLVVVGVGYTDTEPAARAYLARHRITYPNGPDRQAAISRAYHISGVPETFLINRAGRIVPFTVAGNEVTRLVGPVAPEGPMTAAGLRAVLDQTLAAGR